MPHFIVAIAAAIMAATQPQAEPAHDTGDDTAELKMATKKNDRHRSIQTGIDLRTTVILVMIGGASYGLFKDGAELVAHGFMVAHVWICFAAILAAGVSLFARSGGLDDSTTGDALVQAKAELAILKSITHRKKSSYNIALALVVLDTAVMAMAITLQ